LNHEEIKGEGVRKKHGNKHKWGMRAFPEGEITENKKG
jgi:hypothetical protein